jgi:HAD superfamily hydrolase (TIGR01509 family)
MTLDAVLWDMDGTLVDTEPVWWRAEIDTITGLGGRWTEEDCKTLVGSDLAAAVEVWMARLPDGAISRADLAAEVHGEVLRGLKAGVRFQPGALELLDALNAAGVPCALVSASYRSMVDAVLSHCPPDVFAVSVAGDEVSRGKPDPEPYLTAARLLGTEPARCVVLEDSPPGAASGNASGALVVAIPQHVPIPAAPRRVQVDSLERLTPDALRRLAASRVNSVRDGVGG